MFKGFFVKDHPKEMYLLSLCEMCQRFAFWGIANLLVLYLVQAHQVTDQNADKLFGLFTGVAFILPLLGGYVSDRLGYKRLILWGCLSSAAGCFLIAIGPLSFIYAALLLIVLGGSVFTPSIYATLGSLYRERPKLREGGFTIYYAAVNIGVFSSLIILGALANAKHWHLVFVVAGLVQLLALWPFYKAVQKNSIIALPARKENRGEGEDKLTAKLHKHEKNRIAVIIILAVFSIVFWMSYNQGASSMTLFALRYTDRRIGNFGLPAAWLFSAESFYLLLLAFPLASLYLYLAKRKKDPSPPLKCALSLFSMGLCFTIMMIGSMKIPTGATTALISPYYLLSAYFLMALGEMLICPIGLSLVTHLSPHRYTAFLVGVWYTCIGIAFYLGGVLAGYMTSLKLSEFFNIFVLACFIPAILLLLLAKKLDRMRHVNTL